MWLTNDQHNSIVKTAWQNHNGSIETKLQNTLNSLHHWGKQSFGDISKKIKAAQLDLQALQENHNNQDLSKQIQSKEKELDDLLEKEETWWSQRSRALWLTHGDQNTKFFHQKASQRRRKNKIEAIKDPRDILHTEQEEIENIFIDHFQQLFSSQDTTNISETVQVVNNKLDQKMHDYLNMEYTRDEVTTAIKNMKSLAAPGPDGLPALFYHTYWEIVGEEVIREVL
jgi:hypothetical protein